MGKYMEEASQYSGGVEGLKQSMYDTLGNLKIIDNSLGIDPENSNDLLTYNVIIGNGEIKEEINSLIADLDGYTTAVSAKAKEIDDRIERERLERERLELEKAKLMSEKDMAKTPNYIV